MKKRILRNLNVVGGVFLGLGALALVTLIGNLAFRALQMIGWNYVIIVGVTFAACAVVFAVIEFYCDQEERKKRSKRQQNNQQ